ncbi:ATP-grasp domain-containing protein [Streptomyces sp. NPDC059590]|uniref:ATP-grasp domain-containing protein n=1 Tax=unclassified Streptomyces TaxID=2593676 RepID=UPI0036AE1DEA
MLLTSAQRTSTAGLLSEAAARRGMDVLVLSGPRGLDEAAGRPVHWYGGPRTADRVAARLGLGLLEPPDAWLARLPREFTGRKVELTTLAAARAARGPVFVKPPSDKSFPAAVYGHGSRLPRSGEGVGPHTPVLVSEVVMFAVEYRLFVLEGWIAAGSRYAAHGRLDVAALDRDPHERAVRGFAGRLLAAVGDSLPSAVTLDVGLVRDPDTGRERWAAVEANMAWFSHSYAAEADAVLDVVLRAAGPRALVAPADRGFLRPAAGAPPVRAARC